MKCANEACKITLKKHRWVVAGESYCSPWCERNKGKHPNTAGMYKNVFRGTRPVRK